MEQYLKIFFTLVTSYKSLWSDSGDAPFYIISLLNFY